MTITIPRHYFLFSSASASVNLFAIWCSATGARAHEMIQKLSFLIIWAVDVPRGLWWLTVLLSFNLNKFMRYLPLIVSPPASEGGKFMAIFFTFAFALLIFTLWKIYRAAWSLSAYTLHLSDFTFQLDLACARALPEQGGQGRGTNFLQRGILRCLITRRCRQNFSWLAFVFGWSGAARKHSEKFVLGEWQLGYRNTKCVSVSESDRSVNK